MEITLKDFGLLPLYKRGTPLKEKYLEKDRTFSEEKKRLMPGVYFFKNGTHAIIGYSDFNVVNLAYRLSVAKKPHEYKLGILEVPKKDIKKLPQITHQLRKEWQLQPLDTVYEAIVLPCMQKNKPIPLSKIPTRAVFLLDDQGNYMTRKISGLEEEWKVCGFERKIYRNRIGSYIIFRDGVPCYVGATWTSLYDRLYFHFRQHPEDPAYRLPYYDELNAHTFTAAFIEVPIKKLHFSATEAEIKETKTAMSTAIRNLEEYLYQQLKKDFKLDNIPHLGVHEIKKTLAEPMPKTMEGLETYHSRLWNILHEGRPSEKLKECTREKLGEVEKLLGIEAPF